MKILLFSLLFISFSFAQNKVELKRLYSEFALESSREKYLTDLDHLFSSAFSGNIKDVNVNLLKEALYKAELTLTRSELVKNGLVKCFKDFNQFNKVIRKGILLTAKACFPDDFQADVSQIYFQTDDPEIFTYAAFYLLKSGKSNLKAGDVKKRLKEIFKDEVDDILLRNVIVDLERIESGDFQTPDMKKILSHNFQKGKTIIYSLHRNNRHFPGLTIIKKPDGYFLRNDDGTIFSVPQLAASASGYPGYLTGGNTPQGIFSVQAFYVSETEDIGPTPSVLTRIAFEKPTKVFYHNSVSRKDWRLEDYQNLLPDAWKNFKPMHQAYYAGMLGRRLIVMHGSVDDLNFYKEEPYFPLTPTRGCISAKEVWSEETGKCLESDQVKLMNAFFSVKQLYGYLVVVEIDDQKKAVSLEEVSELIDEIERR